MTQFKAFASGVEVSGDTVLAVVAGMGLFKATGLKILAEHGIPNPQAGQWYSQQDWLDAFQAIAVKIGVGTLPSIARAISQTTLRPPEVDTIEKALASMDGAYHRNYRGGEIGSYRFEPNGPKSGKLICHTPYPSEFDQGTISALLHQVAPPGVFPVIKLDESAPTRKTGGEACTFLITW
jgi:hypothetical protein